MLLAVNNSFNKHIHHNNTTYYMTQNNNTIKCEQFDFMKTFACFALKRPSSEGTHHVRKCCTVIKVNLPPILPSEELINYIYNKSYNYRKNGSYSAPPR
jgi:hypothetical protein